MIIIGGILISAGKFIGTTNTSLEFVEEKITIVSTDVKDIKNMIFGKYVAPVLITKTDEKDKTDD